MRIAIVGAGFSGLSVAWHLLQSERCEVILFDSKGIGGGASGIAAGLMHPYVGEEGRRSLFASEGMAASLELIDAVEQILGESVARRDGIIRHPVSEEQNQQLLAHCKNFDDIEPLGERSFLIKSGVTIDCPLYLRGLWKALSARGAQLVTQEVSDLQTLEGFDHIVVAAGAGISTFPELARLRFSVLKGQVLICRAPDAIELPKKSSISKGYIALSSQKGECHIGSTYERSFSNELPDLPLAKSALFPKIEVFFPEINQLNVVNCMAALRVIRKGHYFPIVTQVESGLWALSAMGSRGLLYHAFAGRLLAKAIISGNDTALEYYP